MISPEVKKRTRFTYEDYLCFPDDRNRHEIIDGDHFMTPSPTFKHQRVSARLQHVLGTFIYQHKLGGLIYAPMDVVFSEFNVVQPDIIYISNENKDIITEQAIRGAPDLIVEIISVSSRRTDKLIKKKLYEKYGVKEYWILDPVVDLLEVYSLGNCGYAKVAEYEAAERFSPALFGDEKFVIDLNEVFFS